MVLAFALLISQAWCLVKKVVERCRAEHLVEAEFEDREESLIKICFLLSFLPSLVENDQCHAS